MWRSYISTPQNSGPALAARAARSSPLPSCEEQWNSPSANGLLACTSRSNACSNRHGDGVRGLNPKAAVPTVQGRIPAPAGSPWPGDSQLHPHHNHREQRTIILAIFQTRRLQLELLVCRHRMHRLARLPQNVLLLDVLVNVLLLVLEDTFHMTGLIVGAGRHLPYMTGLVGPL